jgi:hypothetical protein
MTKLEELKAASDNALDAARDAYDVWGAADAGGRTWAAARVAALAAARVAADDAADVDWEAADAAYDAWIAYEAELKKTKETT